jgi:hypothetical protein
MTISFKGCAALTFATLETACSAAGTTPHSAIFTPDKKVRAGGRLLITDVTNRTGVCAALPRAHHPTSTPALPVV